MIESISNFYFIKKSLSVLDYYNSQKLSFLADDSKVVIQTACRFNYVSYITSVVIHSI